MKTELFQHEVTGVTKTLGRKHDIDIVFEGDDAGTEGTTIRMPALPSDVTLSNTQARGFRGFADHEAAGIRHSDPNAWEKVIGAGKDPDARWKAYAKAVEDMRVERQALAEYPGIQKNIAGAVELQAKQVEKRLKDDPSLASDAKAIAPLAITLEGRRQMGTATAECEEMLAKLDPKIRDAAVRWNKAMAALPDGPDGTVEAIRLAKTILGDVETLDRPPPEGGSGGSGGGAGGSGGAGAGGSGSAADGSGSAYGDGKDAAEGAGAGDSGDGTFDGSYSSGGGGGGIGAGSSMSIADGSHASRAVFDPSLAEAIRKEVNTIVKTVKPDDSKGIYRVFSTQYDKWHTRHDQPTKYGQGTRGLKMQLAEAKDSYDRSVRETKSTVSVMRRKLERMVLSTQRRDWNTAQEQGAIDPRRLTQAAMGALNVHRTRSDRKEMDTAVCVLIDLSGSMGGSKAALAQQIAIALAQCLETIGASYAFYGFNNTSGPVYYDVKARCNAVDTDWQERLQATTRAGAKWGRTEPLDMYVFKDWDERLAEAHGSMGSISMMVAGNNSDADALQAAWGRLRERREKRKIMFVLSDGQPAWHCEMPGDSSRAGREAYGCGVQTKRTVRQIMAQGCEMVGVGILDDSVKHYYPKFAVTTSLDEFTTATMDMMAATLLGQRARVSGKVAA